MNGKVQEHPRQAPLLVPVRYLLIAHETLLRTKELAGRQHAPEAEALVQAFSARPLRAMLDLEHKIEFTANGHLSRYLREHGRPSACRSPFSLSSHLCNRRVRNIDMHGWEVEVAHDAFLEMLVTQKHHAG